jgi:hypothetical protein
VTPHGDYVVFINREKDLRVWTTRSSWRWLGQWIVVSTLQSGCEKAMLLPDGTRVVAVQGDRYEDNTVRIIELASGDVKHTIAPSSLEGLHVKELNSDGQRLFLASTRWPDDKNRFVVHSLDLVSYDLEKPREIDLIEKCLDPEFARTRDSRLAALLRRDWGLEELRESALLEAERISWEPEFALARDGGRAALICHMPASIWDLATGREQELCRLGSVIAREGDRSAYIDYIIEKINKLVFTNDGRFAVTWGQGSFREDCLKLWDIGRAECIGLLPLHKERPSSSDQATFFVPDKAEKGATFRLDI